MGIKATPLEYNINTIWIDSSFTYTKCFLLSWCLVWPVIEWKSHSHTRSLEEPQGKYSGYFENA